MDDYGLECVAAKCTGRLGFRSAWPLRCSHLSRIAMLIAWHGKNMQMNCTTRHTDIIKLLHGARLRAGDITIHALDRCKFTSNTALHFGRYVPSAWEIEWYQNKESWTGKTCEMMVKYAWFPWFAKVTP